MKKLPKTTPQYRNNNDEAIIHTTLPYTIEITTQESKTQSIKSWTLSPRVKSSTTEHSPTSTNKSRAWNAVHIDKNWREPSTTPGTEEKIYSTRTTKKSRVWNLAYIDKDWQEPTKKSNQPSESTQTTQASIVTTTSKYTRKKPELLKPIQASASSTTDSTRQLPRRRDHRPRTATYRRHSEVSTAVNPPERKEDASIAITPRYHAAIRSENSTQRSVRQEPALSLQVSNGTNSNNTFNSTGISQSSRGSSGNSDSNIFNPAKATFLINSNASLLEQIRSTVAPLLSALGARTPVFAGTYKNINNTVSCHINFFKLISYNYFFLIILNNRICHNESRQMAHHRDSARSIEVLNYL